MRERDSELVTASEIASYAFCPEAWRLGDGLGLRPGNEASLDRGEALHAKNAALDRKTEKASRAGLLLLASAALTLVGYLIAAVFR